MEAFDIFNATQRFNDCGDMRPWLVVRNRGNTWACFPISSHSYNDDGFFVSAEHPDFPLTGLTRDCYILDNHYFEITPEQFARKRGVLSGDLLAEFRKHAGI